MRRLLLRATALALLLALAWTTAPVAPLPPRVAPGVRLWGRDLGGWSEARLRAWLAQLAPRLCRPPEDARVDPVTGGAIPDLNGACLDAAGTAAAVLAATPGPVAAVYRQLPARVRLEHLPDRPVYRGHPALPEAALLINVAWGEEHLPALLDALARAGARATFFFTGRWAARHPDLVRAVAAAGHEVASHGYSDALDLERAGEDAVLADFARAAATLAAVAGRPPRFVSTHRGVLTPAVRRAAARLGQRLVMWTVDTVDWRDPPPARLVERVRRGAVPGALVLAHPRAVTAAALPTLLQALAERGLTPVTLGALLDPTLRPPLLPEPPP